MDCEECFGYGACHVCYGRAAINRLKKENEQLKTAVLKAANLLAGRKEQYTGEARELLREEIIGQSRAGEGRSDGYDR